MQKMVGELGGVTASKLTAAAGTVVGFASIGEMDGVMRKINELVEALNK